MARLPPQLPRTLIHHEPDNSHCQCGCALKLIGADVSEKLDCTPGVFTVERHIRGKWVCDQCETLIQAPVPAQVSDKGIPTVGLLAHIMVAKFADHLPLYHQEKIFGRAGLPIARSTLAQWVGNCGVQLQPLVDVTHDVVHADETQVQMLTPGAKKLIALTFGLMPPGSSSTWRRSFTTSARAALANMPESSWAVLVCDDFASYKPGFELGVTEIGCMAHARRTFFDLHASNESQVVEKALHYIAALYEVEREVRSWSRVIGSE